MLEYDIRRIEPKKSSTVTAASLASLMDATRGLKLFNLTLFFSIVNLSSPSHRVDNQE
jgi:hypothetical protein